MTGTARMLQRLVKWFIIWARRRATHRQRVVTFQDDFSFSRFEFLWPDEWPDRWWDRHLRHLAKQNVGRHDSAAWTGMGPRRRNRPPVWRPFNAFLHCWNPRHDGEQFHDHPRWSITICLRGELIERTPWSERTLRPGAFVFRGRKAIHAFEVAKPHRGKTWTIFIVGRRNHRQNRYVIEKQ